jgi:Protein of unknown function (DUF2690)
MGRRPSVRPMTNFRRSVAVLLAVVAGAAVSLADQAPLMAATSGCGNVCDGKDPDTYFATVDGQTMRCSFIDVQTPHTATNVELRYSPFCRTAWARQTGSIGWLSGVLVQSFNTDGTLRKQYDQNPDTTSGAWSPMVNDKGLTARACFYVYANEVDYEVDRKIVGPCTARY